jgi:hypothetical protein
LDWTNRDSDLRMWEAVPQTGYLEEAYKAFVDSIVPRSPDLAELYGMIQYYGALDFNTDEYLIMSMGSLYVPVAVLGAEVLNTAARQYLYERDGEANVEPPLNGSYFARLTMNERLAVMAVLLGPDRINYFPVQENFALEDILPIFPIMNRLTFMGYYSEWWGYGSTRILPPSQRVLEYFPGSWEQIGYPGPSLGYRAARTYDYTE